MKLHSITLMLCLAGLLFLSTTLVFAQEGSAPLVANTTPTPTATPLNTPTPTPTSTPFFSATVNVSTPVTQVVVGDIFTVTTSSKIEGGCGGGMMDFTLEDMGGLFVPLSPTRTPGDAFVLQAQLPGTASLCATGFGDHSCGNGAWYWHSVSGCSEPITVLPQGIITSTAIVTGRVDVYAENVDQVIQITLENTGELTSAAITIEITPLPSEEDFYAIFDQLTDWHCEGLNPTCTQVVGSLAPGESAILTLRYQWLFPLACIHWYNSPVLPENFDPNTGPWYVEWEDHVNDPLVLVSTDSNRIALPVAGESIVQRADCFIEPEPLFLSNQAYLPLVLNGD